jgi:hypothetical protein
MIEKNREGLLPFALVSILTEWMGETRQMKKNKLPDYRHHFGARRKIGTQL